MDKKLVQPSSLDGATNLNLNDTNAPLKRAEHLLYSDLEKSFEI